MSNQGKQSPLAVNVTCALLQSSGLKINANVTSYVGSSTGVSNYSKGSITNDTVLGTISDVIRLAYSKIGGTLSQTTYDSLLSMGSAIPALANSKPSSYTSTYSGETNSYGFLRMFALQANNEFKFNSGSYSDFVASFSIANGYKSMLNKQINTLVNGKKFLDGVYSNMNDLISADLTGVSLATTVFGQDCINLGKVIDLSMIQKFGLPSVLLQTIRKCNALTQSLSLALLSSGLKSSDVDAISKGITPATQLQEQQIYGAFLIIQGENLAHILAPLQCKTLGLTSLADLLNVKKLIL